MLLCRRRATHRSYIFDKKKSERILSPFLKVTSIDKNNNNTSLYFLRFFVFVYFWMAIVINSAIIKQCIII